VVVVSAARPPRQWQLLVLPVLAGLWLVIHYRSQATSIDYLGLPTKLLYLVRTPIALVDALPGHSWLLQAAVWSFLACVAALRIRSSGLPQIDRRYRALLLSLLLAYLLLPFRVGDAIFFDLRLALPLWLFLLAVLPRQWVTTIAAKVVVLASLTVILFGQLDVHRQFEQEGTDLLALCEAIPPNQRVLGLNAPGSSEVLQPAYVRGGWAPFSPYAHAPSMCHIEMGGRSPTMTFHPSLGWVPLRLLPGDDLDDVGIADVFDSLRIASQLQQIASHYDYLLVSSEAEGFHRAAIRHAMLVDRRGRFGLYRVREPSTPAETTDP
jgi:hypothetical protein